MGQWRGVGSRAGSAAVIMIGIALGLGVYTFGYAKGASYLSTDPAVCANCHIMQEHFDAWQRSSHRSVATCSDCHMPHDIVGKYLTKASNGFWHSVAFTSGWFPDPLQIKSHNRRIAENACRDCHTAVVDAIDAVPVRASSTPAPRHERPQIHDGLLPTDDRLSCIRCHTYVGHWVR